MAKRKKSESEDREQEETPAGCTPKKVTVELLPQKHEAYGWWAKVIENTGAFDHLREATVAIFWRKGWRKSPDGPVRTVHVQKMNDTVRALTGNQKGLAGVDFCVFLNYEEFNKAEMDVRTRNAWLDYAASQMERAYNRQGEQAEDELGRPVWRKAKPIEVFDGCLKRQGAFAEEFKYVARAIDSYAQKTLEWGKVGDEPAKLVAGKIGKPATSETAG